ncbi:MAG: magnesium-translocating P-type ATPase [Planctomycetaceae bacterium]|nr:magnesium-translocating P-type ATPase [Planctomycetaceae bacterium]
MDSRNGTSPAFWSSDLDRELAAAKSSRSGLTAADARGRLQQFGPNRLEPGRRGRLWLLISQFRSPITLLLIGSAVLSIFLNDTIDAVIILAIVAASSLLGYWQEKSAADALASLLALVSTRATVLRDGKEVECLLEEIVPGDVAVFSAGSVVPGDCRIVESRDLFVNEAALTGETFAVEKAPAVLPADTPLNRRTNCLFYGTHVVCGTARALVIMTGARTQFGGISQRLQLRAPETEFERGVRRFGYFLVEVTLLLVLGIFAINAWMERPILEALLFSLALAVGLTPQLLPAIISVNLSHGAQRMAQEGVIVRRLASIENFGSIDVLCSDKTGTLTEGTIRVEGSFDVNGQESLRVLQLAWVNSSFESGFANPIDEAVRASRSFELSGWEKLDEIPYDFIRKRLSVFVREGQDQLLITKGALSQVLACCSSVDVGNGRIDPLDDHRDKIEGQFRDLSSAGKRVLGVAYRKLGDSASVGKDDESGMVFAGLLSLADFPKPGIAETVQKLSRLGVRLKMLTGDNALVARQIAEQVGMGESKVLTGEELSRLSDGALLHSVNETTVFAELEPNQKEQIVLALKKAGQVVGYLGDGINDVTALHSADVGISVDQAVDVAKEAADLVLLKPDLEVLIRGIREGRATFANTLKYVFMATSANFGNMFSMAGASLFLPYLPLLPKQILLMNLMTDLPEMAIATDSVDPELTDRPRRWNVRFIRNFMLVFGTLSSLFDFLTFGILLKVLHADQGTFRTGWFVESVVSATLVVLVIRTRRSVLRSRPGRLLGLASLAVVIVTLWIPFSPIAAVLGFKPLTALSLGVIGLVVMGYIAAAELTKRWFYHTGHH